MSEFAKGFVTGIAFVLILVGIAGSFLLLIGLNQ